MPSRKFSEDLFKKNLLLTTLPIFIIGVVIIVLLSNHIYRDVEEENSVFVKMIAGEISSFFNQPKALIMHYKENWESGLINGNEAVNRNYEKELNLFKFFESVYFADKNGIIINAFFSENARINRDDYIGLDIGNIIKKKSEPGVLLWSDSFISLVTGEPTIMIYTRTKKGTIVASVNFKSLKGIIDRISSFYKAEAFVVNRNGYLISHVNYDLVLQQYNYSNIQIVAEGIKGKTGSYSFNFNGKEYVGSSFILPEMGWVVCFIQEKSVFLKPVLNQIIIIIAGMMAAITLGFFIAGRMIRRITDQVGELIFEIRETAEGNRMPDPKDFNYYEIQEVSDNFRKMADAVRDREHRLNETYSELKQSEEKFRQLAENMHEVFWIRDYKTRRIFYVSPSYERIWGRDIEETYRNPDYFMNNIYVDDIERVNNAVQNEYTKYTEFNEEFRVVKEDGEIRWVWARSYFVRNNEGEIYRIVGVGDDITDKKALEILIVNSLKEKETLLKEIHHRVKNNLQIISSLLQMQSITNSDEKVSNVIDSAVNRITSMALIHDKLYKSDNLSSINASKYIEDLAFRLKDNFNINENVIIELDVMDVAFSIDVMIPIGLILNELLTNSLKYAFNPSMMKCLITIKLKCSASGDALLEYYDNGTGIPPEIDFTNTKSLGLPLVYNLTKQIGGTVEMSRENGSKFVISFESQHCSILRSK